MHRRHRRLKPSCVVALACDDAGRTVRVPGGQRSVFEGLKAHVFGRQVRQRMTAGIPCCFALWHRGSADFVPVGMPLHRRHMRMWSAPPSNVAGAAVRQLRSACVRACVCVCVCVGLCACLSQCVYVCAHIFVCVCHAQLRVCAVHDRCAVCAVRAVRAVCAAWAMHGVCAV